MTDRRAYTRRRFLAATAAASAVAGCSGEDGEQGTTTDPVTDADPTANTGDSDRTTTDAMVGDTPTVEPGASDGTRTDVTFREGEGWSLEMDLYLPEENDVPFLVFAHGGGWFTGDKGQRPMFPAMTDAGIAVADIQYRLAPSFRYPAAVRDLVAAIKWVRANAGEFGVDADCGAVAGYSAGAHLATLVGFAPDHENFQPPDYHPEQPVAVDAVVGYSGPYDFTVEGASENGMVANFFGEDATDETFREGSPRVHVDSDDPPTMLVHGTEDSIVPYRSTTVLETELDEAGVPAKVITGEGAGHGMIDSPDWREETLPAQRAFLEDHLG